MCIYYTGYVTTNQVNGKKYIGVHVTEEPNDRYLGSGTVFTQALKKYGRKHFHKEVIAYMLNEEVMYEWEVENVTQEVVNDPMYYNCKTGGLGGCRVSSETRTKMSIASKGRIKSAESRAKISIVHKGKIVSDETKAKMSIARRARPAASLETRAKMSVAQKNKSAISDKTRAKISAANHNRSAETRAKISAANKGKIPWIKGKKMSAESIQKREETKRLKRLNQPLQ